MVNGGRAVRARWSLPDWTWLVWPPLGSLAVQLAGFLTTGVQFGGIVAPFAGLAVWLARIQRMNWEPPVRPSWVFLDERRVICGEIGGALAVATVFVTPVLASLVDGALSAIVAVPVLAAAVFVVPRLAWMARGLPELRLLPEGIAVRGRRVRWEDIDQVELRTTLRPNVVVRVRSRRAAVLRELHVHANLVFLLDLIGYYLAHPERRAAIGTAEEADRITAALREARLAAPIGAKPIPLAS